MQVLTAKNPLRIQLSNKRVHSSLFTGRVSQEKPTLASFASEV